MKKHNLKEDEFDLSEIESIIFIGEGDTVDIEVEGTHMFFANDIYTHNSGMEKDEFGLETISESLGKAEIADVVLGVARTNTMKGSKRAKIGFLKNRNGEEGHYLEFIFDTYIIDIRLDDASAQGRPILAGYEMAKEETMLNCVSYVTKHNQNITK